MKKGFTLVELLVVIGIIAILAGLLLPVLIGAKETALISKNNNNIRQLTLGVAMYSSESYYGEIPQWNENGDTTEVELVTALGRLYNGGNGVVADWNVFSSSNKPCKAPDKEGPMINGVDDINHDDECSFSMTKDMSLSSKANRIIIGDEGSGNNLGMYNFERGNSTGYVDTHVKFHKTDNPKDDLDKDSLYEDNGNGTRETFFH
jgi:prepilin-type N-terminal cleavage/methylation domain-containing protein